MNAEKLKILIVDDEPDIVAVLRDFLTRQGYQVMKALSGEEALDILGRERIDLVLLDLKMPGLKGTDAAKFIKKKYPSVKVIVLTGYPDMSGSLLQENILDAVFIKPVRIQELLKRLLTMLGQKEREDFKTKQLIEARDFLIGARLLFIESSSEIYDLIKAYFEQLSKKGKHYLLDVAGNEDQIMEKLALFNPDILLINAPFLKGPDKDIILDVLTKNSQSKEILVYNIDDIKNCDEKKLERITKNVKLTCFLRGLM